MNLLSDMRDLVIEALKAAGAAPSGSAAEAVAVEAPRDLSHGDLTTNAAMVLAAEAGAKPRALAATIALKLEEDARIDSAEVAGPGFVNLRLTPAVWRAAVASALKAGPDFGRAAAGERRADILAVAAAAGGGLTLADARGAVFADALGRLLVFAGWRVETTFRFRGGVRNPRNLSLASGANGIESDLRALGVETNAASGAEATSEEERVEAAVAALRARSLVREGEAGVEAPVLFMSTAHGDAVDRALKTADGAWTDLAFDIAVLAERSRGDFDRLVDVAIADDGDYAGPMTSAAAALSEGATYFDVVRLRPVAQAENGASDHQARDLVGEVGRDVARFAFLHRRGDATLQLNARSLLEPARVNPIFNVQYAHALAVSDLGRAAERRIGASDAELADVDLSTSGDEGWEAPARKIAEWPRVVEQAALRLDPQAVAAYLHNLASVYHAHRAARVELAEAQALESDHQGAAQGRLAVDRAVSVVIASGLGILGVTPATKMR